MATSVSRELVDVLESQITAAVRREWWGVVDEFERPSQGMRDLLAQDQLSDPFEERCIPWFRDSVRSEILNEHEPEN